MQDEPRSPLMPPNEPVPLATPRGGLAPKETGGLTRFMSDVTRGVRRVTSSPLYAAVWSGAVSGMAQDPTAGPRALQQLRASRELSLDDELKRRRLIQMDRTEADLERQAEREDALRQAVMSGDQRSIDSAYAEAFPQQAVEARMKPPPAPPKPQLDWEYGEGNVRRRVQVNPDGTTTPLASAKWVPIQPPIAVNMPSQEYARGGDLRKEWNDNVVKNTKVGTDAMRRVSEGAKRQTAAGDMAVIFGYMKTLDPGSTVREGEYATAENAASIPDRIRQAYNKAISGEKLTPEQRDDFVASARAQFNANFVNPYLEQEKFYRGVIERSGLKADDVMYDALGDFRPRPGGATADRQVITPQQAQSEGLD